MRVLYGENGKKGVYTRKRGLDRETNKALLLKHVKENAKNGSQMKEFYQVLLGFSRSNIQVLLRELGSEGRIRSEGLMRGAKWYPSDEIPNCNSRRDNKQ